MVAERWSAAPESLSNENKDVEEMKSVAPDAIDAAGDVAGYVAGWTGDETRIGAEDVEARPGDEDASKAEQLVEVLKTVLQDRIQQRTVEQIADVPVPQMLKELAEVFKSFRRDRIQQRIVEQTIPAIPLAEKIVELPVIQTEEKIRQGVNTHAQHVVDTVEVQKPIIQEKINPVTKHLEDPLSQFTGKAMDIPVVAQRQISMETVQKSIETPQLQYCDEVVDIPAVLVVEQVPRVRVVKKTVEDPQFEITDKVIDVPVVSVVQVPQVHFVKKTVEDSTVGVKTAEVLRFNTSKPGDEQNSSEQYVDRMKEGQNDMCYVTDESIAVVSSLFEENLRKKGHEVPYMADPVDEKKTLEELKAKLEPLIELMKEVLGDKVEEAIVDDRTVDLLRVLTTSGHGLSVNMKRIMKAQASVDNANVSTNAFDRLERQQHNSKQQQQPQTARQPTRQEREKERGERKKEEREAEERRGEQVKKDVTDWTVVTRNRRQRKMVQIFVRVNGSKVTPMEVNLTDDRVEDVMRRIQNDEDAYVTLHGRVLKRGEKLKSCEVTDGCTIEVTSRLRGGGKHKDKRSKADTKQGIEESGKKDQQVGSMSDKCQEMTKDQKDALIQTIERNEGYRRLITTISEAENWEHEIQCFRKQLQEQSGIEEERAKVMEWGMRWAVEARKRGRGAEQEQRRQEVQGQNTGRGSAGLVRGGDERCRTDETSRKGKGKGNGGKGEHDGKTGGAGSKGRQQVENLVMDEGQENMRAMTSEEKEKNYKEDVRKLLEMVEKEEMELEMMQQEEMEHEEQRGRVAPNMGAGGSHPQATSDPRKKKKETREMRWADCEDDERQEEGKKEQETEKETRQETGQEELTNEKPPGLEQKEDEEKEEKEKRAQEAREDEERRAQEAREEQRRAQETREEQRRAQEAREEHKRAQEAREKEKERKEEERRAQEAREQKRVQEAQAREAKAQEEREREMKAQEEREREVSTHEERREQEREAEAQGGHESDVKAQEGHEGEVKAQEEQGEDANSLHEESHVSNRHMTWWRNAWWVRVNNGPHLQTARDRRRVWRAATRAAQEVRETGKGAGGEREKREQEKIERTESNTLHVVFHFPTATTATTAAAAATAATVRLQ